MRLTLFHINSLNPYWLLLLGFLYAPHINAQLVQVTGYAAVGEQDLGKVRQSALQDAMRQASLQVSARVESSSQITEGVLSADSVRIRALATVGDVVILDEWLEEEKDLYAVMIRAQVKSDDVNFEQQSDRRYRRKLAVMQFEVKDRSQISDMPGIEIAMAQEFARRLELDEQFITVDASQYLLPSSAQHYSNLGQPPAEVIVDLAERMGVQFIVHGSIRDMGITRHAMILKLRHVELEVTVYDGISGAEVTSHRMAGSVTYGQPFEFPVSTPVMADKFFAGPTGQATNKIMNAMIFEMAKAIRQLPFTARVVQAQGTRVQLDVGGIAQLKVGDVLMAYKLADSPLRSVHGQQFFGFAETPTAALVVKQVQPLFATAELENDRARLNAGDVVRFAW